MLDEMTILRVLPRAVAWAELKSTEILRTGKRLSDQGLARARRVGVARPELIRVSLVASIPLPEDAELGQLAISEGLLGPDAAGLTLGYGIYLVNWDTSDRLFAHECRHVHQYEQAGSIARFLPVYLQQIANHGYENAPLEVDARAHEND